VAPHLLEECLLFIHEALTEGGLFIVRFNATEKGVVAPHEERWPGEKLRNERFLTVGQWRLPVEWLKNLVVGEHKRFTVLLSNDFHYFDADGNEIAQLGRVH
jgi:hypothetical protein